MAEITGTGGAFRCPFCGLSCIIGEDGRGPVAVLHAQPMCSTFTAAADALEFLQLCNRELDKEREGFDG